MSVSGSADILWRRPMQTLGLLFFMLLLTVSANATTRDKMTVVQIRPVSDSASVVCFMKSQRLYKLPLKTPKYKQYMTYLKWSEQKHAPVTIVRAREQSDVILQVVRGKAKRSSPRRR